jgi:hypothetical protein
VCHVGTGPNWYTSGEYGTAECGESNREIVSINAAGSAPRLCEGIAARMPSWPIQEN